MYTITDDELVVTLTPAFAVSPDYCSIFKDNTSPVSTLSDSLYSLNLTPTSNTLTFSPDVITDLTILNGNLSEDYTFTIRQYVTSVWDLTTEQNSDSVTVTVTFKNPCVDTSFVTVTAPDVPPQSYTILNGAQAFTALDECTIVYNPAKSSNLDGLCGNLNYKVFTDPNGANTELPSSGGDPLSFDPSTRVITAESSNENLIDTTLDY